MCAKWQNKRSRFYLKVLSKSGGGFNSQTLETNLTKQLPRPCMQGLGLLIKDGQEVTDSKMEEEN